MPLIKYSAYIIYPDGSPAGGVSLPVWLLGGNVLVPLFTDKAGTLPLANPLTTDVDGLATFYAAPGPLTAELAGQLFHFQVDPSETDPAWPGTFIHTQSVAASVWTVNHHFGVRPEVDIVITNESVVAEVGHPTASQTTITFGSPATGTAYLRR